MPLRKVPSKEDPSEKTKTPLPLYAPRANAPYAQEGKTSGKKGRGKKAV